MPGNPGNTAQPEYPDVLGTITGGVRHNIDIVQCAFAVYPPSTAVGQPVEALVLLQNTCDKPIQVTVSIQLPRKDSQGNRMSLITPKDEIQVGMQAGETGLLHVPVVPHLPTQTSENNKMTVQVQSRIPKNYKLVRQPHGGRAATALNMSPFRLNILREVGFTAIPGAPGTLTSEFSIIPGHVDTIPPLDVRYETLWSAKEYPNEQAKYTQLAAAAERFAATLSRTQVYQPLISITEQRFARVGLPLHPGESLFVAKLLTYIMEDGLDLEEGFELKQGRWFNRLASIVSDQYMIEDDNRLVNFLYTAVVHDSVRVGLNMVERTAKKKFGTQDEHFTYADEVVSALEGNYPIDLSHVYLPLILAGIMLHQRVKAPKENLWGGIGKLREAWAGRQRLADSHFEPVAEMLEDFLHEAENQLYRARIPKP
jgi:hypothetical protein